LKTVDEILTEQDGGPAAQEARAASAAIDRRAKDLAEIGRLAELSPVNYDRERKDAAKRLGIRASALDREVERLKSATAVRDSGGQGRPLDLKAPEPWPTPVDGAVLLAELVAVQRRFVVLPDGAAEGVALWTIFAHAIDAFIVAPRLMLLSATMRSGKTTLLRILARLVPRPLLASNISPAAIFRVIEAANPTLLIDELDTFAPDNEPLRGILNSGHTKEGATVIRLVGDNHEPRQFSTWAAIAMAAIGRLPSTWIDRSVVLHLKRKRPSEKVSILDRDTFGELDELARKAARFASDNVLALGAAKPKPVDGLNDRAIENWRPLLAIADVAGGDWPKLARSKAQALSARVDEADDSLDIALLRDVKSVFAAAGDDCDRLFSARLCAALIGIETGPWSSMGRSGKPLTPGRLARRLAGFDIPSGTIRIGKDTAKGYQRAAFADAFERYLTDPAAMPETTLTPDSPSSNRNTVTTVGAVGRKDDFKTSHKEGVLPFENGSNPLGENECDGVTFSNPPEGGVCVSEAPTTAATDPEAAASDPDAEVF
jgi:putative DNA primase/helicase